jgi:hypothetical protein
VGQGQPYGWLDLLQFCGYAINGPGMVCSTLATYILRAGRVPIFGRVPAERITPANFLLSDELDDITTTILDGLLDGAEARTVGVPVSPAPRQPVPAPIGVLSQA